jgi:hypothetical protein
MEEQVAPPPVRIKYVDPKVRIAKAKLVPELPPYQRASVFVPALGRKVMVIQEDYFSDEVTTQENVDGVQKGVTRTFYLRLEIPAEDGGQPTIWKYDFEQMVESAPQNAVVVGYHN